MIKRVYVYKTNGGEKIKKMLRLLFDKLINVWKMRGGRGEGQRRY